MDWLNDHLALIALAISEILAVVNQLFFPDNKGVGGILAFIIKVLQSFKK